MQDNPAHRAPRVFRPRDCVDCSTSFVPLSGRSVRCPDCQPTEVARLAAESSGREHAKRRAVRAEARLAGPKCSFGDCGAPLRKNNTLGRCQKHRYIGEGMGECAHCGKPIRRDNQIGYCEEHKYPTSRAPVRLCASREGCDRQLRIDNTSGYCADHFRESPRMQAIKDRINARLREQTRLRPDTREVCSVKGCENRLRSDNAIGRCTPEHKYLPLNLPKCEVDGCENRLTTTNVLGRCMEHRGQYWAPDALKCRAKGCGKTLHADNSIGYCHKHRLMSPVRQEYNRQYYQDTRAAQIEYSRLYREVHPEKHREAARRWAKENPGLRSAARMRRRMWAQDGLTDLDKLMSLARCLEMTGEPCFYCGAPSEEVEHFFPLCKGGTDAWENILPSCMPCNRGVDGKHSMCGTAFMLWRGNWKPFMPPEPTLNRPAA